VTTNDTHRTTRQARLKWVPIADMRVSPLAQREINRHRVDRIAADFDPEEVGNPTVSWRDGHWYVIDGQHRIEAMRQMGWEDQQIQCWTYEGLTEAEEAERFLRLNDVLAVDRYARFKVGVAAARDEACEIDRVVRLQGLVVSRDRIPGAVRAVGTLERVYRRSDSATLGRTLRIIRDAYGDPGLEAAVIDGIGHLCARYNGVLDEAVAVERLSNAHGGANGLLGKAEMIRHRTGNAKGLCVGAAAVEIINAKRGGMKLPSWWT
jgi:Family of unknown function (DUF6551)